MRPSEKKMEHIQYCYFENSKIYHSELERYRSVPYSCSWFASMSYDDLSWAPYQIRKIACCTCPGNAGNIFPTRRLQRKPLVSDPGMHHGTCVTHVPWCMSGSVTCGGGENVPDIPGACAPEILRIWQEAHGNLNKKVSHGVHWLTHLPWEPHICVGELGQHWFRLSQQPMLTYCQLGP